MIYVINFIKCNIFLLSNIFPKLFTNIVLNNRKFSSVIGFILFHTTIRFFLQINGITAETTSIDYLTSQGMSLLEATQENAAYDTVMGIFTYRMSIFGGIVVGLWTAMIDGEQISGALNIFNQLLMSSNPNMDIMRQATRLLTQGTHPFMVFDLPAACFAMYKTALPKNREKVKVCF